MRRSLLQLAALATLGLTFPAFAADESGATYGAGKNRFAVATGSPGELGRLKLLQEKKVGMVMVHAPAQVDKAPTS
jgi:tungstate transport system substrate-binding protein